MSIRSEKQREQRAIEGHPRREAMIRYNRSDKHRACVQRRRKASQATASNSRKQWTLEDECKLEQLYLSGLLAWEIGVMLGRSLQGIERKLQRLKMFKSNAGIQPPVGGQGKRNEP